MILCLQQLLLGWPVLVAGHHARVMASQRWNSCPRLSFYHTGSQPLVSGTLRSGLEGVCQKQNIAFDHFQNLTEHSDPDRLPDNWLPTAGTEVLSAAVGGAFSLPCDGLWDCSHSEDASSQTTREGAVNRSPTAAAGNKSSNPQVYSINDRSNKSLLCLLLSQIISVCVCVCVEGWGVVCSPQWFQFLP